MLACACYKPPIMMFTGFVTGDAYVNVTPKQCACAIHQAGEQETVECAVASR